MASITLLECNTEATVIPRSVSSSPTKGLGSRTKLAKILHDSYKDSYFNIGKLSAAKCNRLKSVRGSGQHFNEVIGLPILHTPDQLNLKVSHSISRERKLITPRLSSAQYYQHMIFDDDYTNEEIPRPLSITGEKLTSVSSLSPRLGASPLIRRRYYTSSSSSCSSSSGCSHCGGRQSPDNPPPSPTPPTSSSLKLDGFRLSYPENIPKQESKDFIPGLIRKSSYCCEKCEGRMVTHDSHMQESSSSPFLSYFRNYSATPEESSFNHGIEKQMSDDEDGVLLQRDSPILPEYLHRGAEKIVSEAIIEKFRGKLRSPTKMPRFPSRNEHLEEEEILLSTCLSAIHVSSSEKIKQNRETNLKRTIELCNTFDNRFDNNSVNDCVKHSHSEVNEYIWKNFYTKSPSPFLQEDYMRAKNQYEKSQKHGSSPRGTFSYTHSTGDESANLSNSFDRSGDKETTPSSSDEINSHITISDVELNMETKEPVSISKPLGYTDQITSVCGFWSNSGAKQDTELRVTFEETPEIITEKHFKHSEFKAQYSGITQDQLYEQEIEQQQDIETQYIKETNQKHVKQNLKKRKDNKSFQQDRELEREEEHKTGTNTDQFMIQDTKRKTPIDSENPVFQQERDQEREEEHKTENNADQFMIQENKRKTPINSENPGFQQERDEEREVEHKTETNADQLMIQDTKRKKPIVAETLGFQQERKMGGGEHKTETNTGQLNFRGTMRKTLIDTENPGFLESGRGEEFKIDIYTEQLNPETKTENSIIGQEKKPKIEENLKNAQQSFCAEQTVERTLPSTDNSTSELETELSSRLPCVSVTIKNTLNEETDEGKEGNYRPKKLHFKEEFLQRSRSLEPSDMLQDIIKECTNGMREESNSGFLPDITSKNSIYYQPNTDKRYNRWKRRKRKKGKTTRRRKQAGSIDVSSDDDDDDDDEEEIDENGETNTVESKLKFKLSRRNETVEKLLGPEQLKILYCASSDSYHDDREIKKASDLHEKLEIKRDASISDEELETVIKGNYEQTKSASFLKSIDETVLAGKMASMTTRHTENDQPRLSTEIQAERGDYKLDVPVPLRKGSDLKVPKNGIFNTRFCKSEVYDKTYRYGKQERVEDGYGTMLKIRGESGQRGESCSVSKSTEHQSNFEENLDFDIATQSAQATLTLSAKKMFDTEWPICSKGDDETSSVKDERQRLVSNDKTQRSTKPVSVPPNMQQSILKLAKQHLRKNQSLSNNKYSDGQLKSKLPNITDTQIKQAPPWKQSRNYRNVLDKFVRPLDGQDMITGSKPFLKNDVPTIRTLRLSKKEDDSKRQRPQKQPLPRKSEDEPKKIQNDTGAANLSMLTLSQLLQTMPGNKTSKVANKKKGFSKQSTVKEKQLPIVDIKKVDVITRSHTEPEVAPEHDTQEEVPHPILPTPELGERSVSNLSFSRAFTFSVFELSEDYRKKNKQLERRARTALRA